MRFRHKNGYRSGLEFKIAEDMLKRGIKFRYEGLTLPYKRRVSSGECGACGASKVYKRHTYVPDFLIGESPHQDRDAQGDGGRGKASARGFDFIIEAKGRLTPTDRAKMLAVKEAHPELDIRFIFGRNNKLNKKKDERYSDWATKHGFPYAIGDRVPREWVQGGDSPSGETRGKRPRKKADRG